jgi:hypothetical protein
MSRLLLDLEGLRTLIERTVSDNIDAERWKRAPKGSPLGRIAFADQRAEIPRGLEPNTEFERRMFDELYEFVGANIDVSPEVVRALRDFLDQGMYDDVLFHSKAPTHYRMMEMTSRELQKLLRIRPDEQPKLPTEQTSSVRTSKVFEPWKTSGLSSWTNDYSVAMKMVEESLNMGEEWCVILVAQSEQNPQKFLDLTKMYDILQQPQHEGQKECVALGPIRMSEIRVFRGSIG